MLFYAIAVDARRAPTVPPRSHWTGRATTAHANRGAMPVHTSTPSALDWNRASSQGPTRRSVKLGGGGKAEKPGQANGSKHLSKMTVQGERPRLHTSNRAGPTSHRRGISGFDLRSACGQIRKDLIGRLHPVDTPFGVKPLVCEFCWPR